VVHADGSLRRLGDYSSAGWSPRGLYAVVGRGRRLYAVEPDGTVHWSVVRPRTVSHPAWSLGLGYRVAYLEGTDLRVVGGDGAGDRLLARRLAPVTPAWRPGPGNVLTYASLDGRVIARDADNGRVLWSSRAGERVLDLEWSLGGRELVVLLTHRVLSLGRGGGLRLGVDLPRASAPASIAVHPSGRSAAVAGSRGGVISVSLDRGVSPERTLFAGTGRFSGLAWSPDGRWLLAGWEDADQWVFIGSAGARRGAGARRVSVITRIAAQLDPGASGRGGFPRPDGWCCG
jgi:hypothetical protein